MKVVLVVCVLVGCKADKPSEVRVVSEKHAAPAGSASSKFNTDRAGACQAFADRMQPSMSGGVVDTAAGQCMNDKTLTKAHYACVMAATTVEAIAACGKAPTGGDPAMATAFETDRKAACAAYGKHAVELMDTDLRATSLRMCASGRMSEASYDCVLAAKDDAAIKKCLLGP